MSFFQQSTIRNQFSKRKINIIFISLVLFFLSSAYSQQQNKNDFIAGTKPDQRPKNAPRIKNSPKLDPTKVLHGANENIPPSLQKAVESQGNWYTPLLKPGMTGPYDIRNYHTAADTQLAESYQAKKFDPIHFPPKIYTASDQQCLACHKEIMTHKVLDKSQAGVLSASSLAWYQTLETYKGPQEDFHWRHLQSPYAKRVMQMKCTTCHQGNDPREEANLDIFHNPINTEGLTAQPPFTLRKMVNPKTCLMCHGQFPDPKIMNLPGPWHKIRDSFQNNCLSCHQVFRTNRHNVNFLNPAEIEKAGAETGDSCYGCHGGRSWYRIAYPYPRHPWPNMAPGTPDWAQNRLTESEKRFLNDYVENKKSQESK